VTGKSPSHALPQVQDQDERGKTSFSQAEKVDLPEMRQNQVPDHKEKQE
jgi:hypothetical protein